MKPKDVLFLLSYVLRADPKASVNLVCGRLTVCFCSIDAYIAAKEEIELDILYRSVDNESGRITWDVRDIKKTTQKKVGAYDFCDSAKRRRDAVSRQEREIAEVYGGKAHVGSGALQGLKSDSSGKGIGAWQVENKSTEKLSYGLSVKVLDKITREARQQSKHPMVQVRFNNLPQRAVMEEDWFVIPRTAFEKKMMKDG